MINSSRDHPLDVGDRGSETQFQLSGNLYEVNLAGKGLTKNMDNNINKKGLPRDYVAGVHHAVTSS